jgi:CubicO group peptidase (beta-lactamase class C family)
LTLCGSPAFAQDNLPPRAAPTRSIDVGALPVIRSESQTVTDYARGLISGLMARDGVNAAALVVISEDRVDMAEGFGGIDADTPLPLGTLSELFGTIAVMQLAEGGRLSPNSSLSAIIGESGAGDALLGDLLTDNVERDTGLLQQLVESASGMPFGGQVSSRIFVPLAMTRSSAGEDGRIAASAGDMGKLLLALVNGGGEAPGGILSAPAVGAMMRAHRSVHHAIPGWTYGFRELYRNGWRAVQRDGIHLEDSDSESRIVIIPESRIAYFIWISQLADPGFWRALDESLFDRLAPPRPPAELRTGPPPTGDAAAQIAGRYRALHAEEPAVFLKTGQDADLLVEAQAGWLRLSGAENLTLQPAPGNYWRSEGALLPAAFAERAFWVGDVAYVPVREWARSGTYLILAGVLALLTIFSIAGNTLLAGHGRVGPERAQAIAIGLGGLTAILLLIAVILHSPI